MINSLIGIWEIYSKDQCTLDLYGHVIMEFKPDGELLYKVNYESKEQVMFMNYEVIGDKLITDQSSFSHRQETLFNFDLNGLLELYFDGIKSTYLRIQ
jgi:hypothetical protein